MRADAVNFGNRATIRLFHALYCL